MRASATAGALHLPPAPACSIAHLQEGNGGGTTPSVDHKSCTDPIKSGRLGASVEYKSGANLDHAIKNMTTHQLLMDNIIGSLHHF
jgi:hypothetical protein